MDVDLLSVHYKHGQSCPCIYEKKADYNVFIVIQNTA